MSYERRILHYSPGPGDFKSVLSDRAIAGCSFELNRLGGCGAGELRLKDEFSARDEISAGDWIAFEYATGERWYFGRVEHRSATLPAGVTFRLEGMGCNLLKSFLVGLDRQLEMVFLRIDMHRQTFSPTTRTMQMRRWILSVNHANLLS